MSTLSRNAMIKFLNRVNVDTVDNLRQWSTHNLARAMLFWGDELERASSEFGFELA